MNPYSCPICGVVPRQMWLFGGHYWRRLLTDSVCPSCFYWATEHLRFHGILVMEIGA